MEYERIFDQRVGLIVQGSPVEKHTVMDYFRDNWFTDEWRCQYFYFHLTMTGMLIDDR